MKREPDKPSFNPMFGSRQQRAQTQSMQVALNRFCLLLCTSLAGMMPCYTALGQSAEQRYQLGRRLTRFERLWQDSDEASRARSTPKMQSAVNSFFSLQLDSAMSKLDEAWLTLQDTDDPKIAEALSDAGFFLRVSPLVLDRELVNLSFAIERQPKALVAVSEQQTLGLTASIMDADGNALRQHTWPTVSPSEAWKWEVLGLAEGDYQIEAKISREGKSTDLIANGFSVIDSCESRTQRVQAQSVTRRPAATDTRTLTLLSLAKQILTGTEGRMSESDLPFAALLSDFEYLSAEQRTVRELVASRAGKSLWLQLGDGKSKQHIRICPAKESNGLSPLVVAFHGAGGSENMFFESYGAGQLIEECKRRGWSVVSPRQSLGGLGMDLAPMLEELRLHLDFDPSKVLLLGHSMGAAQAISQVSKFPTRVRAVAAIGGGGSPVKSAEVAKVPFFVAAGEKDFGLSRAKSLTSSLQGMGAKVDFLEVKDVEHMVIVQATLPQVMRFFDECVEMR